MQACLITSDVRLFESFERFFGSIVGQKLVHLPVPYPASQRDYVGAFQSIADSIDQFLSKNSSTNSALVIVDPCFFASPHDSFAKPTGALFELNPLSTSDPSSIFGMLLMVYPELHWVFLTDKSPEGFVDFSKVDEDNKKLVDEARLQRWHLLNPFGKLNNLYPVQEPTATFLFDPTGLRNYLRSIANKNANPSRSIASKSPSHYITLRPVDEPDHDVRPFAAAIDEEEPYAYLHGYLAYKLGYLTHVVTTEALMRELFGKAASGDKGSNFALTVQDIFQNFPDHPSGEPQSDLQKRFEEDYTGMKNVDKHIFVSAGHKYSHAHQSNLNFLRSQKALGKPIRRIFKPSGGMFHVLQDAGLLKDYWKRLRNQIEKTKPEPEKPRGGHSAPGRLLAIADRLINRAEKLLEKAQSVQECIRGATLALEATELLGYRTPTTALEAIALRHQLEVKAECMFYGVAYNIDVESRFKELEMEVKAVARWFHSSVRKKSLLNAQMSIITEIARIFRDYGQFDEEQQCLRRLRDLNRRWYFSSHPWFAFFWPIRWYVEKLVGSFTLFIIALLTWPFVFGVFSHLLCAEFDGSKANQWQLSSHIMNAYISFFGLQPVDFPMNPAAKILTLAIMLTGFIHLGIFIAHLYTLITRR